MAPPGLRSPRHRPQGPTTRIHWQDKPRRAHWALCKPQAAHRRPGNGVALRGSVGFKQPSPRTRRSPPRPAPSPQRQLTAQTWGSLRGHAPRARSLLGPSDMRGECRHSTRYRRRKRAFFFPKICPTPTLRRVLPPSPPALGPFWHSPCSKLAGGITLWPYPYQPYGEDPKTAAEVPTLRRFGRNWRDCKSSNHSTHRMHGPTAEGLSTSGGGFLAPCGHRARTVCAPRNVLEQTTETRAFLGLLAHTRRRR